MTPVYTSGFRGAGRSIAIVLSLSVLCLFVVRAARSADAGDERPVPPKSPDGSVKIALVAAEPTIVTPIGATIDAHGRLLVIESNSHFRPKDYHGPATDRILLFEDPAQAGTSAHATTFFEGQNLLMNLAADRDGSVVVSSRDEVFRLTPDPAHGAAPRKKTLAHLDTQATYPHDGLAGLTLGANGQVYFAIGENLGAPWTLIGADGKSIHETTGSGCIFRVDRNGNGLVRVARGLWNPFGLGMDPSGQLWAVDNDPDGRPPSRLLQVTPGGDYGFEFRYGRTGLHPLQAWDGELPGTLGMVSGVGEAPCSVRPLGGDLLVTSWRDHQIERYTLTPRGAGYTASMTPILVGGPDFRPVCLAPAPDGSVYVTDWGSGSYQINGRGRIWRMTFAHPTAGNASGQGTVSAAHRSQPTDTVAWARSLQESREVAPLLAALGSNDPIVRASAQFGLSQTPDAQKVDWSTLKLPEQRIGFLAALLWRGADVRPFINDALSDPNARVREMGVRAVTEQNIKSARSQIEKMLGSSVMTPRLVSMIAAAIAQLDGDPAARVSSSKVDSLLLSKLNADDTSVSTKAVLLRMLPANRGAVSLGELQTLLKSASPVLQLEVVRHLSDMTDAGRFPLLARIAQDPAYDNSIRAEALLGLGNDAAAQADLLMKFAQGSDSALREEALRSLRSDAPNLSAAQKQQLEQIARQYPKDGDMVARLLGHAPAERPADHDIDAWEKILKQARGNPDAGRRIFFSPSGPACFRCHTIEGRGRSIGPDLTMIGHSQDPRHVLESILDPSREIAPLYTYWHITTKNGQQIDGMLLRRDGQEHEVYVDASGQEIKVNAGDVTDRKIRKESVMPEGLVQALTDQELRDLVAMLTQKR